MIHYFSKNSSAMIATNKYDNQIPKMDFVETNKYARLSRKKSSHVCPYFSYYMAGYALGSPCIVLF